jgi:hypothetical protein
MRPIHFVNEQGNQEYFGQTHLNDCLIIFITMCIPERLKLLEKIDNIPPLKTSFVIRINR